MKMKESKLLKRVIIILCVVIPLAVAGLYLLPSNLKELGIDTSFLAPLNAIINSITSLLLILALVAVKNGNYELHKKLMFGALGLGALFLVSYVIYHATNDSTKFGDINHDGVSTVEEKANYGNQVGIYYFFLLTHVALSIVVLPFVLFAAYFGLTSNNQKHKKIVKFAYPVWLYVSVTGVIVYLMISPFYV